MRRASPGPEAPARHGIGLLDAGLAFGLFACLGSWPARALLVPTADGPWRGVVDPPGATWLAVSALAALGVTAALARAPSRVRRPLLILALAAAPYAVVALGRAPLLLVFQGPALVVLAAAVLCAAIARAHRARPFLPAVSGRAAFAAAFAFYVVVGLRLPGYHYQAGRFDHFKNEFEDLIGADRGARGEVEDNGYLYQIGRSRDGRLLLVGEPHRLGLGDLVLAVQWQPLDEGSAGNWLSLAFRYELDLPTGSDDRGMGSGGVDHNLIAAAAKELGLGFELHANLGVTIPGSSDLMRGVDRQPRIMGYAGIEWQTADRLSLILQLRVESSPFDNGNRYVGGLSTITTLGVGWRVLPGLELRAALHEEFPGRGGDFDVAGTLELRFAGGFE